MNSGVKLGPYETLNLLGSGGMGEVWKAHDSRLQRVVAIKLLRSEFTDRIEAEARAIAALSHPCICTLHDIRVENGTCFLVMEYLEGKPFQGPLPVDIVIARALEVLDGLNAAHSIGIVHLDLKPANILITKSGAKVLDFGLAKRDQTLTRNPDGSQTLTITQVNNVAGTPAYMSPEQLEGRNVDARADIFGFGCVLYEALTGKPAFCGESIASLISSVLLTEPKPLKELQPHLPAGLDWIVRRCLAKDRDQRWQHVLDLRATLSHFAELTAQEQANNRRRMPLWGWAAAGMLALACASAGWFLAGRSLSSETGDGPRTAFELTGGDSSPLSPSWSPDGKWLVYSSFRNGNYDLWKKPVLGGLETMLTTSAVHETTPAWSPKGNQIAFSSNQDGGGIFLIHPDGGAPTRISDFGSNPAWSPDGSKLVFDWQSAVYIVEASGGQPNQIVPGTSGRTYAIWAANGSDILMWHRARGDVFKVSPDRRLTALHMVPPGEEVSGLSTSGDGKWLFLSRGSFGGSKDLWRVPMNPKTGVPVGAGTALTLPLSDHRECQVSPDGHLLAFSMHRTKRHLWLFPLDTSSGLASGPPRQLTFRGQRNYYPALTPDGRTVIYTSQDSDKGLLYFQNLDEKQEHKLTREWARDNREVLASFSPAGAVVFASTLQKAFELYRMPSLGSVGLRITTNRSEHRDTWPDWSPDGKTIVFQSNREGNEDLWTVQADGSQRKRLTSDAANESYPAVSPDGLQVAYVTDKPINQDVWVRDLARGVDKPLIQHPATDGPGEWSPDGKRFYFLSDRDGTVGVWVTAAAGGEARRVFALPAPLSLPEGQSYGSFAVGARELIVPLESRESSIHILEGVAGRPRN